MSFSEEEIKQMKKEGILKDEDNINADLIKKFDTDLEDLERRKKLIMAEKPVEEKEEAVKSILSDQKSKVDTLAPNFVTDLVIKMSDAIAQKIFGKGCMSLGRDLQKKVVNAAIEVLEVIKATIPDKDK